MSLFKDMLKDSETLFKNEVALDFSFVPKLIPYRENQQKFVARCIKPLFQNHNGINVLIHGLPGVGKTVAIKHILQEIEDETEEIIPLYVNCWQKNTVHKIVVDICDQMGLNILSNQKTDEILKHIFQVMNRKSLVLVLDEIDKLDDNNLIYSILEEIYRKTIIMITNYKDFIIGLDKRIKSRLSPEILEFAPYNEQETIGILKQRIGYAFIPNVWTDELIGKVARKTYELKDIRSGLDIIRKSAKKAEMKSQKNVTLDIVEEVIGDFSGVSANDSDELDEELKFILKIIKDNSGKRIGDLFKIYTENGGKGTYKTFQRKIKKLTDGKFITIKKIIGGTEGSTTLINFLGQTKL